jgi:hypothetical protein
MITPTFLPPPTKKIKLSSERAVLEKHIEEDNRKHAKSLGVMFEKFTVPNKRSVPDRILTYPSGLIAFIEYKAPKKRATDKQFLDHVERRVKNVLVFVIDDKVKGRLLIDWLYQLDLCPDNATRANWIYEASIANRNKYTDKSIVE